MLTKVVKLIKCKKRNLMKNINAVIFDLDDTLLDRTQTFSLYIEYFYEKFLMNKISLYEKQKAIQYLINIDKNGYENRSLFYNKIIDKWNLEYNPKELENNWIENFHKFTVPSLKLFEILEYLKHKYVLGIITNGLTYMQKEKIKALKIKEYFKEILISEDIGIKKPDKEIFLLCCERLNIIPSEAVYIGDNIEIDIMGAKNAGLNGIWLNKFNIKNNYKMVIEDLESLKKYL